MAEKHLVKTTECTVEFKFENIKRDFDILEICIEREDNNPNPKYIGSYVFDVVDFEFPALAVLYSKGNKMYCLYPKNTVDCELIKEQIELSKNVIVTVRVIEPDNSLDIYPVYLAQLLCNSLNNDFLENYHNLSGRLYYTTKNSMTKNQMAAKEVRFQCPMKGIDSFVLKVSMASFTKLSYFRKNCKETEFYKLLRSSKYVVDKEGNFRRVSARDSFKENELYILKGMDGKKNTEAYVAFASLLEFENSRGGVLHQFLKDVRDYLDPYICIQLNTALTEELPKVIEENLLYKSEKEYFAAVQEKGINIVDLVKEDVNSSAFVSKLRELFETVGISNVTCKSKRSDDRYNLIIIHSPEYYIENKLPDPHNDNPYDQHIIYENYLSAKSEDSDGKKISLTVIKKILYELLIKQDVLNNQLSLYNWREKQEDVHYVTFHKENVPNSKRKKYVFHRLTISPDKQMSYQCVDEENASELYWVLRGFVSQFTNKYVSEYDLQMIIYTDIGVTVR